MSSANSVADGVRLSGCDWPSVPIKAKTAFGTSRPGRASHKPGGSGTSCTSGTSGINKRATRSRKGHFQTAPQAPEASATAKLAERSEEHNIETQTQQRNPKHGH